MIPVVISFRVILYRRLEMCFTFLLERSKKSEGVHDNNTVRVMGFGVGYYRSREELLIVSCGFVKAIIL